MGISTEQRVYRNLSPSQLYEHALRRREGVVTAGGKGPFAAVTSPHTGRSPNDKFLVQEPESSSRIWWGKVNQPITPEKFDRLKADGHEPTFKKKTAPSGRLPGGATVSGKT